MKLASFEDSVGNTLLKRGQGYLEGGHIETLEEVENGVLVATVKSIYSIYGDIPAGCSLSSTK